MVAGARAVKRAGSLLCLAFCAMLGPAATAQTAPPSPFAYSCGDLLAAQTPEQRATANLMIYWVVGYLYGELDDIDALQLDGAHHDGTVTDVISALQKICPNVPDLAVADFARNLATDVRKSTQ